MNAGFAVNNPANINVNDFSTIQLLFQSNSGINSLNNLQQQFSTNTQQQPQLFGTNTQQQQIFGTNTQHQQQFSTNTQQQPQIFGTNTQQQQQFSTNTQQQQLFSTNTQQQHFGTNTQQQTFNMNSNINSQANLPQTTLTGLDLNFNPSISNQKKS